MALRMSVRIPQDTQLEGLRTKRVFGNVAITVLLHIVNCKERG